MSADETIRKLKDRVRKHPALLSVLQPPVVQATVALRRWRMAAWYPGRMYTNDAVNAVIHRRISMGTPSAFGKMGTLELQLLVHDSRRTREGERLLVPAELRKKALTNVGIFPVSHEFLCRALDEVRQCLPRMDVLAVYGSRGEPALIRDGAHNAEALCATGGFDPWLVTEPWSAALEGKRVLVVHPFTETIESQYSKHRARLWPGRPALLPEFDLQTLRMPLSPGLVPPAEADWMERLKRVRDEMDKRRFDVALIGAGGMSLPLAVHAKGMGAVGFHLGGSTQLLFGIRGRRWDEGSTVSPFFNDSWARPAASETPSTATDVEGGCYW